MATKMKGAGQPGSGWDPAWETRDDGIPKERYISQGFADMEAEKLWPHAWQMACREEEIPRPGDYTVYEIADQSIVLIRTNENTIKAYHNVCPHRATALAVGSGRFSTGEITCPFHGWRWNLEGESTFVLDRNEFKDGCLANEDIALREVQVAQWIGMVFINMDKNAPSFWDHIEPVKQMVEDTGIGDMRIRWCKKIISPGNWKVAQEAFHEAYHVMATHPELWRISIKQLGSEDTTHTTEYRSHGNGHGSFGAFQDNKGALQRNFSIGAQGLSQDEHIHWFIKNQEWMSYSIDAMVLEEETRIAQSMKNRDIPEDSSPPIEFQKALYEHYKNRGRKIASPEGLSKCGDVLIFPNFTFLPTYGNALCYRARPLSNNDPDWCQFEFWSIRTYAEGETIPRAVTEDADIHGIPFLLQQDFRNIPRMQRGFHSHGIDASILAAYQEQVILNMHREVDKYLKA